MTTESTKSAQSNNTLSFPIYAVFFLIPLLLLGIFTHYALFLEEDFRKTSARRELERELEIIVHQGDPTIFYSRWFNHLEKQFRKLNHNPNKIEKLMRSQVPTGPVAFEYYFFDRKGRPAACSKLPPPLLNKRTAVWKILRGYWKGNLELLRLAYRQLIGLNFPLTLPEKRPGEVFPTASYQGRGLICLFPGNRAFPYLGTMFFLLKTPSMTDMLSSEAYFRRGPKFSRPTSLMITDVRGETHEISGLDGIKKGPNSKNSRTKVVKRIGNETFRALRHNPETDLSQHRKYLWSGIIILSAFILFAFPYISVLSGRMFFSIRWKIPLLFLYSIIIPLAGATLLSHQTIRDRRETMTSEIHQKGLEILSQFDSDFTKAKTRHLQILRNFRQEVTRASGNKEISAQAKQLKRSREVSWIEVRDRHGKTMATTWVPDLKKNLDILTSTIAKLCLKRFHPNLPPADKSLDLTLAETFILDFFLSPISGWPRVLERPDELHSIRFTDWDLYLYWSIIASSPNDVAFLHSHQRIFYLRDVYFKKYLKSQKKLRPFILAGWSERESRMFAERRFPGRELKDFFHRLRISQEPIIGEIKVGNVWYLATGLPGRHLNEYHLAALYPRENIDIQMTGISRYFFAGICLVCMLALIVGNVLSNSFLAPIRELAQGVEMLRKRDISKRLAVSTGDEFGELAATFNRTLDGMDEILLAQQVQSQFIPATPPKIPGYTMDLVSIPARDLGGDYCDIQPLLNGNFLFIIGDATGHGVSSALVMTMAKAGVLDFLERNLNLTELMKRLNHQFFTVFKRQVVMTFFAAVLDPESGKLWYSNAGHPFPILFRKSGITERLALPHAPLGFSKREDRLTEKELVLESGEIIFFFTDVLIEMRNPTGKPWGPKNLIAFLHERRHLQPQEIRRELLQFAADYTQAEVFDDDFTLMILRKD